MDSDLMIAVLQAARAEWNGCDWDTPFSSGHLDLRGLRSRQARLAAQATRGTESMYWREVCEYLETVEHDARRAAELAEQAVKLWKTGNLASALARLEAAITVESQYREPVAYRQLKDLMQIPECVSRV